jgi:hypothetical protein
MVRCWFNKHQCDWLCECRLTNSFIQVVAECWLWITFRKIVICSKMEVVIWRWDCYLFQYNTIQVGIWYVKKMILSWVMNDRGGRGKIFVKRLDINFNYIYWLIKKKTSAIYMMVKNYRITWEWNMKLELVWDVFIYLQLSCGHFS